MKRYLIFAFLFVAVAAQCREVLLVGHRGSSEGVENTLDAYRAGADRGYYGLETDIRVTKDGQFVCSHDANLKEWGAPKVIVEKTPLRKLRQLILTQKRWNMTYTSGKITTLEEYLDLCIEKDVVPVIELKWTTGINSNNLSNLPRLLDVVKGKGLMKKAVFISFMREPLQYIREHEGDDIQLQFLCSPHTERPYFEWMKQYHIDLDICRGFSRELVERYHEAGLKVNCWTIDDADWANEEVDFGVDMLTTNKLVASDLRYPEPLPRQPEDAHGHLDTTVCVLPSNGDTTGVCVYLPAGYNYEPSRYPVLYLLHGSGDDETGWADKGNMVQIMDSMIMAGLCRPMVVVMPNGYMETYPVSQHIDNFPAAKVKRNFTSGEFEQHFPEIVAWAEATYHIRTDKKHCAIAGLSMGGFHTFHIAHYMPYKFDYVAPFSGLFIPREEDVARTRNIESLSDYSSPVYRTALAQIDEQFRHAPHLFWIACGEKDFLYKDNIALCLYLEQKGYPFIFHQSEGGHSWKNWQDYLTQLLPMLF